MRAVWSFFLALLMSVFLSQIVAQQLAIAFHSQEEFIAVMALLLLFAVICIVVLSLVFVVKRGTAALNRASIGLSLFVLLAVGAATVFGMSQSDWTVPSSYDLKLIAEIVVPALIVVAVQWWFVRRHFKSAQ